MRLARRLTPVCLTALVLGCADSPVSPTEAPKARIPSGVASNWYPTLPDGSPDYSTFAVILNPTAAALLTGSAPTFTGTISGSGIFVASAGEITITPVASKNRGQLIQGLDPVFASVQVGDPNSSQAKTWQGSFSAICEARLTGVVDLRAWNESNGIRWGNYFVSPPVGLRTAGPTCVMPTVSISPSGTVTVPDGGDQNFTATIDYGSGGAGSTQWYVDGTPQGSGTSWLGSFSPGVHTVSLVVTNGAGHSQTSNAVTVVQQVEETDEELESCGGIIVDDPTDCDDEEEGGGSGEGGGGHTSQCEVWRFTLRMSHDGGVTWDVVSVWYEYFNC